jgi:short-subunit dehydrogenase
MSIARRFGAEGHRVALISRRQGRLDGLAAELAGAGVQAAGFAADIREPGALRHALDRAAEQLGPVEVLEYSPLPAREFMKPVAETTVDDVRGPLEFSVLGAVAAVQSVLPGMRALGRGTILFTTGGASLKPHPGRAGISISFAGEVAYAEMLHEALAPEGVHVSHLVIRTLIETGHETSDPDALAGLLWDLHTARDRFRVVIGEQEKW